MSTKVKIVIIALMTVAIMVMRQHIAKMTKELEIKRNNEASLLEGINYYKRADSVNVASVGVLKLKRKELEKYNAYLVEEINKLNIKLKRVESAGVYPSVATGRIEVKLKDTLVLNLRAKSFTFDDGYLKQKGIFESDSLKADYTYRDTVTTVVHRIPKRFLFFKWGTKAIKLDVFCKNPKAVIISPAAISLVK